MRMVNGAVNWSDVAVLQCLVSIKGICPYFIASEHRNYKENPSKPLHDHLSEVFLSNWQSYQIVSTASVDIDSISKYLADQFDTTAWNLWKFVIKRLQKEISISAKNSDLGDE